EVRAATAPTTPKPARRKSPRQWWEQAQPASFAPGAVEQPPGRVVKAQAQAVEPQQAAADVPPDQAPPGVLTRQGVLVVEPSIEYTHTDINRFVVGGVAILDTVLVGSIEASQADRDSVTATMGLRYGITDRIEAEVRVPYMYRNDSVTNTVVSGAGAPQSTSLDDHGLGDVEAALHWQVNDGGGSWPFLVTNLRVKSTTGDGPFDVGRNAQGIEEELATGSGFWGVEPSLTIIAPSDPAVFYGNIGYLWNVKDSVDKTVANNRFIRDVDPGDAVRVGFGMGLALNEKVSFSVGYQHDFIMSTKTEFADGDFESESLSVGSLTLGVNWQMTDTTALNVNVGIGVTEDAPDVRVMARVPIAIDLFR
ncbi:MAG TPA: transporter, partial [Candidatus Omnitrophota bacterium]|nr:transporter [Candidatus Omnitrophota bacterium]